MTTRSPLSDSMLEELLLRAEMEVAPDRIRALDAAHDLTDAQCLAAGNMLAEVAHRHYHIFGDEDDSDDDPDERLEERLSHAAVLQMTGGAPWLLDAGYGTRLAKGGRVHLRAAVSTLHAWSIGGDVETFEPAQMMLPWPKKAGRDAALRLAEGLLSALKYVDESEPAIAAALRETMGLARRTPLVGDAAFVALGQKLLSKAQTAMDDRKAAALAEEARTDEALNRRAYSTHIRRLIVNAVASALEKKPDFETLFHSRVQIGYPKFAIEEHLETYYSWGMAGFDELLTMDEETEEKVCVHEIHELVKASVAELREEMRGSAKGD